MINSSAKHRAIRIITLCLSIFLFETASAKETPPEEVVEMFSILSTVEEHFEKKEYDEAQKHMLHGKETLKKILPILEKKSRQSDLNNFKESYIKLYENIKYYDTDLLQKSYIELNEHFIKLIDIYEFKVPPFLSRIDSYLKESLEALEKEDYQNITNELDEIAVLFNDFSNKLAEKGAAAKELEAFTSSIATANTMIVSKNNVAIKKELEELRQLTDKFIKLF